ncbi:MAG: SoxR reducing system RseC family protein [Thiolinea sp.]
MIEQTARVISTQPGYAWVEPLTAASSACGACPSKGSTCSSSKLFNVFRPAIEPLQAANPLHAKPGDEVIIGLQGQTLVVFSMFAYLLPLLSLLAFAMLGKELFIWLEMPADLGAILAGISGLLSGLKLAAWLAQRNNRSEQVQPVILRQREPAAQRIEHPLLPAAHL